MKPPKIFSFILFLLRLYCKFLRWVISLFYWGTSKSKQFSNIVQMLIGATVMLVPLTYSFFTIPLSKTLAIFITFAGAVFGTWLFAEGLRQYKNSLPATAPPPNEETVNNLKNEIERLQNMQLNVSSIENLLSVSLLEIDTHFQDFKKKTVADAVQENVFGKTRKITEYLGYFNEKIKVRYGIDLKKIRIHDSGTKIVVSGIKCEYQGVREQDTVNTHYELREKRVSADGSAIHSHKVVQGDKDSLLLDAHKEHQSELKKKLNSGIDLTGLEGASTFVEKLGEEFVRNFFFRTGREIEFSESDSETGYPLEEYVQRYNRQIEHTAGIRIQNG